MNPINEMHDLIDRLEAAEKERESWKGLAQQLGNEVGALRFRLERRQDELNRLRANLESAEKERDALRAKVEAMEQPAPTALVGARKVTRDFRWDSATQCHVPTLKVEFEPVHIDAPTDAKGWQDQDRIAAMLEAAPEAKP